jgi:hypothetical protein
MQPNDSSGKNTSRDAPLALPRRLSAPQPDELRIVAPAWLVDRAADPRAIAGQNPQIGVSCASAPWRSIRLAALSRPCRSHREQASEAGEYVARNVAQYPFEALLLAGAIGYGIGLLLHRSWFSEPRQQTSASAGHSDDVLLDVARARMTDRRQPAN